MVRTIAYFKRTTSEYVEIMEECNNLVKEDFGPSFCLKYFPDLLMAARDSNDTLIGFLVLHCTAGTGAWEIGTLSVKRKRCRNLTLQALIDGASDAIALLQRHGIIDKECWLVRKVRHTDMSSRELYLGFGFSHPENWQQNVLCDAGYVAFDPFDVVLMKRRVAKV